MAIVLSGCNPLKLRGTLGSNITPFEPVFFSGWAELPKHFQAAGGRRTTLEPLEATVGKLLSPLYSLVDQQKKSCSIFLKHQQ